MLAPDGAFEWGFPKVVRSKAFHDCPFNVKLDAIKAKQGLTFMKSRQSQDYRSGASRFAEILRLGIVASWSLAMVAFWALWLASSQVPELGRSYTSPWVTPFAILFFPTNPLLVLGFKRFSKLLDETEWTDDGTEFQPPQSKSIGGMLDPVSDPLDPRSGILHYRHFHPD